VPVEKNTYRYTEYEKASMSVVRELTSCYLTMLNKLMTSIEDDNTAERRSPNVLSRVYQTVVHGSLGFSGRFSGIQLVLGFWSMEQNHRKENSCLTSQEISDFMICQVLLGSPNRNKADPDGHAV
jgi:hypothetical protein